MGARPSCRRCGSTVTVAGMCVECLCAYEDPGLVIPGVTLFDEIGSGGHATVYAGRMADGRPVAVKVMEADTPEFRARFEREVGILQSLDHPNILPIYGAGAIDGRCFLITELATSGALAERVPLDLGASVEVVIQLCDALTCAHERGVVHRDVKPQNVLIAADGSIKLADFGTARSIDPTAERITATGQFAGTPYFVAPEVLHGAADDPRMDVYSLGVVLYNLMTGSLPIGYFEPLPGALGAICRRALAPVDERYPTIRAMRDDLVAARPRITHHTRRVMPWIALAAIPVAVGAYLVARSEASDRLRASRPSFVASPIARPGSPGARSDRAESIAEVPLDAAPREPTGLAAPTVVPRAVDPKPDAVDPKPDARARSKPKVRAAVIGPAVANEPATGTVVIVVRPWADVVIDDIPRGRAEPPLARFVLARGLHTIVLSHPVTNRRSEHRIEVGGNEVTVRADLGAPE